MVINIKIVQLGVISCNRVLAVASGTAPEGVMSRGGTQKDCSSP